MFTLLFPVGMGCIHWIHCWRNVQERGKRAAFFPEKTKCYDCIGSKPLFSLQDFPSWIDQERQGAVAILKVSTMNYSNSPYLYNG